MNLKKGFGGWPSTFYPSHEVLKLLLGNFMKLKMLSLKSFKTTIVKARAQTSQIFSFIFLDDMVTICFLFFLTFNNSLIALNSKTVGIYFWICKDHLPFYMQ